MAPDGIVPIDVRMAHGLATLRRLERPTRLALLVLVTGALAGVAALALLALLNLLEKLVWPGPTFARAVAAAPPERRVLALLGAGALTTVVRLVHRAPGGASGVVAAVWQRAGVLPLAGTVARSLLSVVDVGLGAALGREGALKEMGAAIASRLALTTRIDLGQRRLLVACGAAAGMAAAYNVPLGGALFGLEVLLEGIDLALVPPMIVCCAIATNVARSWSGNEPAYLIPAYTLEGPMALVRSIAFGAVFGVISALVVKGLRWFATAEQRSSRLAPFMPLVTLGALGIASIWLPQLLGNGYDVANAALHRQLPILLLATLPILRFLATATGRAASVPGGLFTPVLSIGALVGGLVGEALGRVWPGAVPGADALLGMGALYAGTSQAPISAVILIAEMSADYQIVLPLVCACGAATVVSRQLERGTVYRPHPPRPPATVASATVAFPLRPARTVPQVTRGSDLLLAVLAATEQPAFVVDERGHLAGSLRPDTARRRLSAEQLPQLVIAGDLAEKELAPISVHATLAEVRAQLERSAARCLPVVDDAGALVGQVAAEDVAA
jgi:CIC family chloride channel protein